MSLLLLCRVRPLTFSWMQARFELNKRNSNIRKMLLHTFHDYEHRTMFMLYLDILPPITQNEQDALDEFNSLSLVPMEGPL